MEQIDRRGEFELLDSGEVNPLLRTKITPPRLHPPFVPRTSLLDRLDRGLDHKLSLVSAPAGFGKTTLVSEWIASLRSRQNPPGVAWVSLDPGDNDPVRFWRYVLTAGKVFGEKLSAAALAYFQSPQPSFQTMLTVFINGMTALSSKAVLVLEDYHVISAAQIHETLTFFLDYLSPNFHLVLMTRSDPPLPLARLRARGELNELRAEDLRFKLDETRAFLEQTLPVKLAPEKVDRLADRTEGWVAGLRLLSLALQKQADEGEIKQFIDSFAGSHRPVFDYFMSDIFDAQPESIRHFLLQTSVLDRLNGSLCDAITGRSDSALTLEQLERDNLFLVSLDAAQQWYRFHALFAEALQRAAQQRLGDARLSALSHAASNWYEAHGMLSDAIEAAISAQEYARAAALIERIIAPELVQNEYFTLRRWIDRLPEAALNAFPQVCMMYAVAYLFTTERQKPLPIDLIQRLLKLAEAYWQGEDNRPKLGDVLAIRANIALHIGDFLGAFSAARQSLELLPENAPWRGSSLILVGMEAMVAGRLSAARQTFAQAQIVSETDRNYYATSIALLNLGEVTARQGELHQAAKLYRQVLVEIERAPMYSEDMLSRRGLAYVGLGKISLEWNDLDQARIYGSQGREIGEQIEHDELLVISAILLARVEFILGDVTAAQEQLNRLAARIQNPLLLREIQAHSAWLALRTGDLPAVQRWHAGLPPASGGLIRLQEELEVLIHCRLLLAKGRADQAVNLLDEWLLEAQNQGRTKSVLEIKILMACALWVVGDQGRARPALIEALKIAQPQGYRRIFLDEGQPVAARLRDILAFIESQDLVGYVRALLYTLGQEQARRTEWIAPSSELIMAPLSAQEQRVLRLLARGLTNTDIAGELIISVNTVKTHVKNIYGKLGVNSREEARQATRHLNLFR